MKEHVAHLCTYLYSQKALLMKKTLERHLVGEKNRKQKDEEATHALIQNIWMVFFPV